jgi:hypothetical protein
VNIDGIAINGSQLPNGRVQRGTPTFARPRINLDGTATPVRRDWRPVHVRDLAVGDVVPGIGVLTAVAEHIAVPPADGVRSPAEIAEDTIWTVTLHGGDGNTEVYDGSDSVYAFTAA